MIPRWTLSVGLFITITLLNSEAKSLTHVSREKLYGLIANRHMLARSQLEGLLNVPRGGVTLELLAKDCRAAFLNGRRKSGLYVIKPKNSPPMVVYCDLRAESGGWTFLQRNTLQKEATFGSSNWGSYKTGFGNLMGDHWLGNELIYLLTKQNSFSVRFLVVDALGRERHADYYSFRVDSEDAGYALRLGDYSGDAGDALTTKNETGMHDNMMFSTTDRDNDRWEKNCAQEHGGGWWFDGCRSALLNNDHAIFWRGLCDEVNPCTSAGILIKPSSKNCRPLTLPGSVDHYPIHMRRK
ncbi:fibrinogen-like protein 1-like protein [Rhinophrynus dorsalis]